MDFMAPKKMKILCYTGYYLPGFKAGGVLKTIANLTDHLGSDFEFYIITRDRDLGDKNPFAGVVKNRWTKVNNANVLYLDSNKLSLSALRDASKSIDFDVIYLNSFFDKNFTIYPILLNIFDRKNRKPIVLATRGELSSAALNIKWLKKRIFILFSKIFDFHNGITFQASSDHERKDIIDNAKVSSRQIKVALDLPIIKISNPNKTQLDSNKNNAGLKIIFLSRISPIKNLDFAIRSLEDIRIPIIFDIYGPIEDASYWDYCKGLIKKLPENIFVNYYGEVMPDEVLSKFSIYDLLFLPSKSENYGHVIVESLTAGTPVLISDKTPWKNLKYLGIGWDLPLNSTKLFSKAIVDFSENKSRGNIEFRKHIENQAKKLFLSDEIINSNKDLFLSLKNRKQGI